MVRSSYRSAWNFPGGGVKKGELAHTAACRELREEIGLHELVLVPDGAVSGNWDGRRDHVYFFSCRLDTLPQLHLDHREIVDAKLMSLDQIRRIPLTGPVSHYILRR